MGVTSVFYKLHWGNLKNNFLKNQKWKWKLAWFIIFIYKYKLTKDPQNLWYSIHEEPTALEKRIRNN